LICLDELISSEIEILTLEIHWLELPKDPAEYYNGYESDFSFNNLSHQVNFSIGLNHDYYLINRHTLSLFNEDTSTGCILPLSKFYLNIKDILPSNYFLNINENKDSSERFKVRIKIEHLLLAKRCGLGLKSFFGNTTHFSFKIHFNF
jgi:hypothetical protein